MKLIPMRTKLDLAILPIGDNFTMDIEDAIVALTLSNAIRYGYHYDTFGYIEIDHKAAIQKFSDKGKDLMLLKIGESIEL
jgi:L-ascorbate metabolism protein UlaG (beta-lactamase superfamily)